MWGYLEYRMMELHMILLARSHGIEKGNIKFDGQFVWLEGDTNAEESKKHERLYGVGERLRGGATNAAVAA